MVQKKCRDEVEITVSIPRRLLIEYVTEPCCPFQPKSAAHKWVEFMVRKAIWNGYLKLVTGGDTNDSRE